MAEDEDREAILARRRRLVALALSGLVTGAGACDGPGPLVCLEPMIQPEQEVEPEEPEESGPLLPEEPGGDDEEAADPGEEEPR